eukprot:871694-Prymnesium_polylepis.2
MDFVSSPSSTDASSPSLARCHHAVEPPRRRGAGVCGVCGAVGDRDSAQPRAHGLSSAPSRNAVAACELWAAAAQAQARAVFPMHPPHTSIVSVHGSECYMVYCVLIQLILRRRSAVKTAFSTASVHRIAVWESTQRFYHMNYTLWAVL